MTTFQFLRSFLSGNTKTIVIITILVFIAQFFSLIEAFMYKTLIDSYLINLDKIELETAVRGILLVIAAWIACAFISRVSKHMQQYRTSVLGDQASIRLFQKAYAHTIALSLDYHETKKTGEVMRQISKARDDMSLIITSFFNDFLLNIVTFSLVTFFFFLTQWQLAVIMLLFVPIFVSITKHYAKNISKVQNAINNKMENIHGSVQQAMDSIMVVQSFNTEKQEVRNLRENDKITHASMKQKIRAVQKLSFWQGSIINLARLSIISGGAYFVLRGEMTVGQVLMLSFWSFFAYNPMYQLSEMYARFREGIDSIERVQRLLQKQPQIQSPKKAKNPKKIQGNIAFEEVSFHYPNKRNILKEINFTVHSGKQLAIVGPSGSGKSTITKLIGRFYDVNAGAITIDGVNIKEWNISTLRQNIGIVLQETILFHETILNNIRYGSFTASKKEVIAAAKKAYAHDFIMSLPEGYDTIVGERGIKLSGGEKQRVLIARTILKNPKILILDEATSALDSESEVIVQNALNQLSKNRTTITIAHRLSTIMNADEILFLEKGKIQERGTHEELLALGGKYKKYVDLQRKKEKVVY